MSAPGIFRPPEPRNEPVRDYGPGSPERESLRARLVQMRNERIEIPCVIGGKDVKSLERHDLRGRFAVVPQDVFLFPGTIATNIAAGEEPDHASAAWPLRH